MMYLFRIEDTPKILLPRAADFKSSGRIITLTKKKRIHTTVTEENEFLILAFSGNLWFLMLNLKLHYFIVQQIFFKIIGYIPLLTTQ